MSFTWAKHNRVPLVPKLARKQKKNSHIRSLEPITEGRQQIHSQISPKEGGMASLLGCLAPIACVGCGGTLLEEGLVLVLVVRVLLIPRRRAAVQLELVRAAERDGHIDDQRYAEDQRIVGHCCTRVSEQIVKMKNAMATFYLSELREKKRIRVPPKPTNPRPESRGDLPPITTMKSRDAFVATSAVVAALFAPNSHSFRPLVRPRDRHYFLCSKMSSKDEVAPLIRLPEPSSAGGQSPPTKICDELVAAFQKSGFLRISSPFLPISLQKRAIEAATAHLVSDPADDGAAPGTEVVTHPNRSEIILHADVQGRCCIRIADIGRIH